jgi:hypothetical protein
MANYHDNAYNVIHNQAEFDDHFADTLAGICKVTVNTCCYLYAAGITSMKSFVEFFPKHDSISKFIDGVAKKEGKDMSLALYRDPAFMSLDITLRFPLVQQIRLTALRLFVVGHSYSG